MTSAEPWWVSKMAREPIIVVTESNSAVAEAYRNLRVAIAQHLARDVKCLTLVSAWPGDGKSMVCTNLAVALGQLHQKVLLIDGDLRRPTISRVFGAHRLSGLSDDLERPGDSPNMGYETKFTGLFVLPRGLSESNPANLLGPGGLSRVFGAYREAYDCIIVDTPPLSACSDALLLGAQSDGAVLIVSPKGWDGEVEIRYKQKLAEHGIPLLGVVLNGAKGAESHGYGYGYGSYGSTYGYGGNYGVYGDSGQTKKKSAPVKSGFAWPWARRDDSGS